MIVSRDVTNVALPRGGGIGINEASRNRGELKMKRIIGALACCTIMMSPALAQMRPGIDGMLARCSGSASVSMCVDAVHAYARSGGMETASSRLFDLSRTADLRTCRIVMQSMAELAEGERGALRNRMLDWASRGCGGVATVLFSTSNGDDDDEDDNGSMMPVEPTNPGAPTEPDEPSEPENPNHPGHPNHPGNPESEPVRPDMPSWPSWDQGIDGMRR